MKPTITSWLLIGLVGFAFFGIMQSREALGDEDEHSQQAEAPSPAKDSVVTLNEKSFAKAALVLTPITVKDGKSLIPASAVVWSQWHRMWSYGWTRAMRGHYTKRHKSYVRESLHKFCIYSLID